jgi:hypothetical protein
MSDKRWCGNPDVLMSYLYEDGDEAERAAFGAHVAGCDACAREVRELSAVRTGLAQWTPPETVLDFRIVRDEPARRGWRSWFAFPVMPAWAQLGAAAMLVGVAVGISGLEVRYDAQGLTVRTGWQKAAPVAQTAQAAPAPAQAVVPVANGDAAPWRADLVALERSLRSEIRPASVPQAVPAAASARGMGDDEFFARVRQLIDASETRQQRELALRIAQVVRDVDTQRRTDLARLTDGMGVIEGRTVTAAAQQKQMMDYLMRVSTQRDPRQ